MTEKYELAQKDYEAGMKYKDIAAKYDVKLNTVKSWKSRYWNKGAPPEKSVHTKRKKVAHKVVDELVDNDDLTDKQKAFCLYYLQRFNAISAYMRAFDADYETAHSNAYRLMANDGIQKQLTKLKKSVANDNYVTASDIAREYAKQAFSDIGDYVDYESKQLPVVKYGKVVHDQNGDPIMYDDHHVRAKPQSQVDTSLIKGVHIERGELVLELYDKVQALDHLNKLLEEQKATGSSNTVNIIRTDRRSKHDGDHN